jgi:hypothetical protein
MDILQLLDEKLGKEEGRKVAEAIEIGLEIIEKKAETALFRRSLNSRMNL